MRLLALCSLGLLLLACTAKAPAVAISTPSPAATEATPTPTGEVASPLPTRPPSTATSAPPPTSTPVPTSTASTGPAKVISVGSAAQQVVALTFDAGADRGYAEQILDTLDREGVVASFGLTGQWAEHNADLVLRISKAGHLIINHTYDHASFTGFSAGRALTQAERLTELDHTEQVITAITGKTTRPYFRPPYGDYDATVNRDVGARGYAYSIMWSIDSGGWQGLSAAGITARCLAMAKPGALYVLHVGKLSQDGPALGDIIAGLKRLGYGFVTVAAYTQ